MTTLKQGTIVPARQTVLGASVSVLSYTPTTLWSDAKTVLGVNTGPQIGASLDQGATWADGQSFGAFGDTIQSILQLNNGEVLVSLQKNSAGNTTAEIWRSTGFNPATATATSWAKVLTASGPGCYFDGRYAATWRSVAPPWSPRAGWVVVNEYGTRIFGTTPPTLAATKAWLSQDNGATWAVIWDLNDMVGTFTYAHNHGCAYDPYDDVIWMTHGDGGGPDSGRCGIYWLACENVAAAEAAAGSGSNPSWNLIAGSQSSGISAWQTTSIIPMETGIVLLPDGKPYNVNRIARRGRRRYSGLTSLTPFPSGVIGAHAWRNWWESGSPLLITVQNQSATGPGPQLVATVDGEEFYEAYRDQTGITSTAPGFSRPLGPDASGTVYVTRNLVGTGGTLIGTWAADKTSKGLVVVTNGNGPVYPTVAQENYPFHYANTAASASTAPTNGEPMLMYFTAEQDLLITRLMTCVGPNVASGLTLARMALFLIAPSGDATLEAWCASDTALWTSSSTPYVRALDAGGGYPTSYQLVAGQRYAGAVLGYSSGSPTMPRLIGLLGFAHLVDSLYLPRHLSRYGPTAQTDMPASIPNASFQSTGPLGVPWFAVGA